MPLAVVQSRFGGPEVLQPAEVAVPAPGPGELRIRQEAVGVNFHDVYVRTGLYRTLALPGVPGLEAVGLVEEVGAHVQGFAPGDRVAYVTRGYGGYAAERVLAAALAQKVPAGLAPAVVAAGFLRGLTAQMLVRQLARVQAGDRVLVHSAGGGVGLFAARLASRHGALVIGTVGSAAKAPLARAAGCAHVIDCGGEDVAARVRDLTAGQGVQVVFDAVGRDTFEASLAALAPRGHLVVYGQSSGPIPPFDLARLMAGSQSVTRAGIFAYTAEPALYRQLAEAVYAAFGDGTLVAPAPLTFTLADAAEAHRALESRERTRPVVLLP